MKPYFVAHPSATVLFFAVLAAWSAVELPRARQRRAEATSGDRGSAIILRLCGAAGAVLAAVALNVRAAQIAHGSALFAAGLMLMAAGIGLRWWSFRTLGRYFTFTVMTSEMQPVIDVGPYRVVRHPSYAGIFLVLMGTELAYGNWLSFACLTVLPLLGLMNRIWVEEAALSAALGEAYTTYARTRKRLVPFVW